MLITYGYNEDGKKEFNLFDQGPTKWQQKKDTLYLINNNNNSSFFGNSNEWLSKKGKIYNLKTKGFSIVLKKIE